MGAGKSKVKEKTEYTSSDESTSDEISNEYSQEQSSSQISIDNNRLDLSNKNLTSFEEDSDQIYDLNLDHNRIQDIHVLPPNLTNLSIDLNLLETINTQNISIQKFSCSLNLISKFTDNLFFPSLQILNISHNSLTSLPDFSKVAPSLKVFDGSFNSIQTIPQFSELIQQIILHHNEITEFPEHLTHNLPNLRNLNLSHNSISSIPDINELTTLQILDLSHNIIRTVGNLTLPLLSKVYFSYNKLKRLPHLHCPKVREYYFATNRIKHIRPKSFSFRANKIDLSDNKIIEIPNDRFFNRLKLLEYFDISFNRLQHLPETIEVSNLSFLNISNNPFEEVPDKFPKSLEQLNISCCNLTSVPNSLINHEFIFEIILPNNFISEFPYIKSLEIINLSKNKLKNFPKFSNRIKRVNLSYNEIEEVPENEITQLNISHNNVKNPNNNTLQSDLFGFYTLKSQKELFNDKMIINSNLKLFGIFNCSDNNLTKFKFQNNLPIEENIKKMIKTIKTLNFVIFNVSMKNTMYYSINGNYYLYVIDVNNKIIELRNKSVQLAKDYVQMNGNVSPELFDIFKVKFVPVVEYIQLNVDMKWILAISKELRNTITKRKIEKLTENVVSADELACKIMACAETNAKFGNLSVVVVDDAKISGG